MCQVVWSSLDFYFGPVTGPTAASGEPDPIAAGAGRRELEPALGRIGARGRRGRSPEPGRAGAGDLGAV